MQIQKYVFRQYRDSRGLLTALEELKDIPFQIKRVYYMHDMPQDTVRGSHAHKTLQQVLICIRGSCRVRLDDGRERGEITLDGSGEGLYIPGTIWREVYDFSRDAVLLVLASELYDASDYIRDYDAFLDYIHRSGEPG